MYSDGGGGDASMFAGGGFMPSQSQPTTEYGGGGAGSRVCWKEFHLSNNAECVFCELELCCPGRCVFLRGREDLGTGRASFEMWNCVGTSELVTDFGVAKSKMSSLPLLCENLLLTPILASCEFTHIRILCIEEM